MVHASRANQYYGIDHIVPVLQPMGIDYRVIRISFAAPLPPMYVIKIGLKFANLSSHTRTHTIRKRISHFVICSKFTQSQRQMSSNTIHPSLILWFLNKYQIQQCVSCRQVWLKLKLFDQIIESLNPLLSKSDCVHIVQSVQTHTHGGYIIIL